MYMWRSALSLLFLVSTHIHPYILTQTFARTHVETDTDIFSLFGFLFYSFTLLLLLFRIVSLLSHSPALNRSSLVGLPNTPTLLRSLAQHTATHCNTLKHTATHCNTLQHAATCCNTLQHTATCCNTLLRSLALTRSLACWLSCERSLRNKHTTATSTHTVRVFAKVSSEPCCSSPASNPRQNSNCRPHRRRRRRTRRGRRRRGRKGTRRRKRRRRRRGK